ncbi:hypothetical protein NDU88_002879 [Pleurodeles waltl]|uniref:Uncharacterized protein n=1 Tax=Pleurodeles waltl TaxID=8319 RepID=A0AAV7M2S3_PLEWA|nr:hypothetical protein NDU88_002879 [Pleurodeles waltl]
MHPRGGPCPRVLVVRQHEQLGPGRPQHWRARWHSLNRQRGPGCLVSAACHIEVSGEGEIESHKRRGQAAQIHMRSKAGPLLPVAPEGPQTEPSTKCPEATCCQESCPKRAMDTTPRKTQHSSNMG